MNETVQVLRSVHDGDPKKDLMKAFEEVAEKTTVLGPLCLVAIYQRPDKVKTTSGVSLYIPDTSKAEDKWQGKVGLLLKMGPLAFKEDETHQWGGVTPKVGDWVLFPIYSTFPVDAAGKPVNGVNYTRVRFVEDVKITAVIEEPDIYY
jgi:hypothetical protein